MNINKRKKEAGSSLDSSSYDGIPILPIEACLAKTKNENEPGCSVLEHLIWVGKIAEELWERLAPNVKDLLPKNVVVALAALHDIGKISPGFQRKIWKNIITDDKEVKKLLEYKSSLLDIDKASNHSLIGGIVLRERIKGVTKKKWSKVASRHHGYDVGIYGESPSASVFGGVGWQELRQTAIKIVLDRLNISLDEFPKVDDKIINLATGFVVVADWLGSDERFFLDGEVPREDASSEYARIILDDIMWGAPRLLETKSFDELFREADSKIPFIPNQMQKTFYDVATEPGVFVIEAPTGLGKTEAALYGAYRLSREGNSGVYFALPTRTTSDKIHERVVPFIKKVYGEDFGVRLAHGMEWTYHEKDLTKNNVKYESQEREDRKYFYVGDDWFRPSKRALLQAFGVGTIDQSLLGVLPVKHSFLRLFGLAGKVVIFDEAHSYDSYTGALLDKLIGCLEKAGASVIVLSATLTRERRARLLKPDKDTPTKEIKEAMNEAYPLISYRYSSGESGQIEITPPPDRVVELEAMERDPNLVAEIAVENAEKGALVLCVTNTVDKAQALYKKVLSTATANVANERIGLLHSRFPGRRREEIEKNFLDMFGKKGDRSQGAILVSTQVVEQSVDIDADLLITDLAPTDMLIQRIGRLWRHKRENRPVPTARTIIVYPPDGEDDSFKERLGVDGCVYQPYVLWRTAEVWRNRTQFAIPRDVRELLESTYATREETDKIEEMKREVEEKFEKMRQTAKVTSDAFPQIDDKNTFLTRYDDSETLDVLIVSKVQKEKRCVTLLNGRTIRLDEYRHLSDAVALCRETISRRKRRSEPDWNRLCQSDPLYKLLVKNYFRYSENFVVLQLGETYDNLSTLDDRPTNLGYTKELGLFDARVQTNCNEREATRGAADEEEGEDGYYDDFEW